MERSIVGSKKILKKEQVLIGIFLIAILVLSSGSMVAFAKSNTYVVKPNGVDDTADIQAAFNACGASPGCTVQLVKGTYHISQIAVSGFQGSFVGAGEGVTIIQALPNLPSPNVAYDTVSVPFWAGMPGPSNPWPDLFAFIGGSFRISGMTITDSYTAPTKGWYYPGNPTLQTALWSAIDITGQQALVRIDDVSVLGTSGEMTCGVSWCSDISHAFSYEGLLLPPGWSNPLVDAIPLSGTFSVTNSVFDSLDVGAWVQNLAGVAGAICYNTITASHVSLSIIDMSNSRVLFCGNQASGMDGVTAMQSLQSLYKPGLLPSTVYVTDNNFQVSGGANAAWLQDFGTSSTLNAVVSGNVIHTDTSCGCYNPAIPNYYSVILSFALKSLVVSLNTIEGGGAAGVYIPSGSGAVTGNIITGANTGVQVDGASGVRVTANVIKDSAQWGIALTGGSSYDYVTRNLVRNSGAFDLYWDGTGTGNVWCRNIYQTSSPSPLPTC